MRPFLPLALLLLSLLAPALAQGASVADPTTVRLTDACGASPPTGCMEPERVHLPPSATTVTLTFVNDGSADVRLDACIAGNATGSYPACPATDLTDGANTTVSPTACGERQNVPTGPLNATREEPTNNSTAGSGLTQFPLTVPACGSAWAKLAIPEDGALGLRLADGGPLVGLVTLDGNVTSSNGTVTHGPDPARGANESTGGAPAAKGTPGFGAPLAAVGVGAAALALGRRKG